ncbi:MAG: glycoside hydrolase family 3 [Oligoflexia bacterium]|nr:MAG: glycoside hydrolase family 3 [Oligoflexia bacterium]
MRKLIGQQMMIGVSGLTLTAEEKKFIVQNNIAGVTLFGRNVKEPHQVRELCKELQSLRHQMPDRAPLFIAIDMEGGRVARLKAPFTVWPPLKKLGDLDSPAASFHLAYYMGLELKSVGINLDFAPCVDVYTNPKNTVIGDRSISTDFEVVAKHASALVRGYLESEVIPCAKHFPGHGNTLIDSHLDLPVEEISLEELKAREIIPFIKSVKSRVPMIMTAHILYKNIDPDWPATLSEFFIQKLLRDELKFKGLVVTDDLGMKAMSAHYGVGQIPVRALKAGANLLLYCNEFDTPPQAMDSIEKALQDNTLSKDLVADNSQKILELKKKMIPHPDPLTEEEMTQIIGSALHSQLSQAIAAGEIPPGLKQQLISKA